MLPPHFSVQRRMHDDPPFEESAATAHTLPRRVRWIERRIGVEVHDFASAVREGLLAPRKHLACAWFYDAQGSELFERICELPEYYLTRAEREILRDHAAEI